MSKQTKVIKLNADIAKEVAKIAAETARNVAADTATSHQLLSKEIEFIKVSISDNKTTLTEIKALLDAKYVTKDQFSPVQKVVYGLAGLLMSGVVVALIALVVNNPK